ncbi:MAG: hypothetical protein KIT33_00395 [Candidatus Kapabacteria bacterium]|nr:hypothetical protein [Ignavibacteriota bacterium]MCW5883407.1 hypothetical protein [Candidatus Kapabacteria bacterium]
MSKELLGNNLNEYEEWLSPILKNLTLILREFIVDSLDLENAPSHYIDSIDRKITELEERGIINFSNDTLDLYYSCEIILFSKNGYKNAFKELHNFTEYQVDLFRKLRSLRNQEAHWTFPMTNRGVLLSILIIQEVVDLINAKYTMPEWYRELKVHSDFLIKKVIEESGLIIKDLNKTNEIEEIDYLKIKENYKMNSNIDTSNSILEESNVEIPANIDDNARITPEEEKEQIIKENELTFSEQILDYIELVNGYSYEQAKLLNFMMNTLISNINQFEDIFMNYNYQRYLRDNDSDSNKIITHINNIQTTLNILNEYKISLNNEIDKIERFKKEPKTPDYQELKNFYELISHIIKFLIQSYKNFKNKNPDIIIFHSRNVFNDFLKLKIDCEFAVFIDADTETPYNFKKFRDEHYRLMANYSHLKNKYFENPYDNDEFEERSLDDLMKQMSKHLNSIKELEIKYDIYKKKTPVTVLKPAILFKSEIIQKAQVVVSYE